MRKSGVAEKHVKLTQDMHEDWLTLVRHVVGINNGFRVEIGQHQGSALNPFLFTVMMGKFVDEIKPEFPWTLYLRVTL